MAQPPISTHDVSLRSQAEGLGSSGAPAGMAEARHPSPRPIAHAEEGEGGRGEWWALAKAVLIGAAAVMLISWLISG